MVPLTMMMHGYQLNTPEGLDDVGGDSGSSLVGVGLPGQRDAVLWHVCDYGFVRRTWQLEGLCGLSHRGVCALWMEGGNQSREEGERERRDMEVESGGGKTFDYNAICLEHRSLITWSVSSHWGWLNICITLPAGWAPRIQQTWAYIRS